MAYILGRKGFRNIELKVDCARADPAAGDASCSWRPRSTCPRGRACTTWAPASGAIALALLDERPDLQRDAPRRSRPRRWRSRARTRGGSGCRSRSRWRDGLPPGDYDLVIANLPYVRDDALGRAHARDQPVRAARGAHRGRRRARRDSRACRRAARRAPCRARARATTRPRPITRAAGRRRVATPTSRAGPHHGRPRAVTREESRPSSAASRSAASPSSRPTPSTGSPSSPTSREASRAPVPAQGPRAPTSRRRSCSSGSSWRSRHCPSSAPAREAVRRLLPGALTVLLANPARRFPLACGPEPERLGLRVPLLEGELAPLAAVRWPVLQSSANRAGRAGRARGSRTSIQRAARRRGPRARRRRAAGHALDRGGPQRLTRPDGSLGGRPRAPLRYRGRRCYGNCSR